MTRDKLTVGIEFHTAHCRLSDRRGWPDVAAPQTVVGPVLGTITKKSIGPIPIPPNTGKYWPIPNTGIVRTLTISYDFSLKTLQLHEFLGGNNIILTR